MDAGPVLTDEAVASIAARVGDRLDQLGRAMGARYRAEIVDYMALHDDVLYGDVVMISIENLKALLRNLRRGELLSAEELEVFRESGARRVHQGVSLDSLLHAYRLWGQMTWNAVLSATDARRVGEREAALRIAGRIIEHTNLVSTELAKAYVDEAQGIMSDREVVRRDLLEALLSGKGGSEQVRAQARSLGFELVDTYLVVLASRGPEAAQGDRPLAAHADMRRVVEKVKIHLAPSSGALLVGLRQGEVVALYPSESPSCLDDLRVQAARLATAVASAGFAVGLGGWHPGPAGVSSSYGEARDALDIAVRTGRLGQPVAFDDVVLGHVLRSHPRSGRLLEDTLAPVRAYDAEHGTDLMATLREFVGAGFNVTRSAAALCVHPNTVVYRLRRIRELTGRDPGDPNDLLLLALGIKTFELEA